MSKKASIRTGLIEIIGADASFEWGIIYYSSSESRFCRLTRWCWLKVPATWLILSVAICLSIRLSHACASSTWKSETANGSLNQLQSLCCWSRYMNTYGNSVANAWPNAAHHVTHGILHLYVTWSTTLGAIVAIAQRKDLVTVWSQMPYWRGTEHSSFWAINQRR